MKLMEIKVNPNVLCDGVVLSQSSQPEDYGWCACVCTRAHVCVCLYTVSYLYIMLYHTIVSFFFIGVMVAA